MKTLKMGVYLVSFLSAVLFLLSCAKPQTIQETMAEDRVRNNPDSAGYRDRREQELADQKQGRDNAGVVITKEQSNGLTIGDIFYKKKDTYHFYIRMECERDDREFVITALKNKKVHWRVGTVAEGEAVSDRDGILEFSYTTENSSSTSVILEYKGSSYTLPITTGPMILVIPRERCGRGVEKGPPDFVGENPPSLRPTDQ